MYRAKIKVTLRKSILDVQGKAVQSALHKLGYDDVQNVRIGKYIELELNDQDETTARKNAEDACRKLLSNPVMEDYSFELEKM